MGEEGKDLGGGFENLLTELAGGLDTSSSKPEQTPVEKVDIEGLVDNEAPISKLFHLSMLEAVRKGATEIHFENYDGKFRVRYGKDDMLYQLPGIPKRVFNDFISRVKKEFGLIDVIYEKQLKQGLLGRLGIKENKAKIKREPFSYDEAISTSIIIGKEEYNLNLALTPSKYGDNAHIEIFKAIMGPNKQIDFVEEEIKLVVDGVYAKKSGLVLIASPHNSGKTTAAYTLLERILERTAKASRQTFVVQDKDAYSLDFVNKLQVRRQSDYIAKINAALKAGADILVIDWVKYKEVAYKTVKAAHETLVIATIPGENLVNGINYLINLGVNPNLVADSLEYGISTRLIRLLCGECKTEQAPTEEQKEELRIKTAYVPKGCGKCKDGYNGQTALYQVSCIDEGIKKQIKEGYVSEKHMREKGMRTFHELGTSLVANGMTSFNEVNRIAPPD